MRKLKRWEMTALLGLAVTVGLLALPAIATARRAAHRASCANNMRQLGLVMKMFAGENGGAFPPLSRAPGNWMMDVVPLHPEYLTDLSILRCPGSPDYDARAFTWADSGDTLPMCVSGRYYNYTSYAISTDEQAGALWAARQTWSPEAFYDRDIELPRPTWTRSDGRGVSGMPVLWDRVTPDLADMPHRPLGINVLHMDGSVLFVPYSPLNNSSNFPATRLAAITFGADVPRMPPGCR